MILVAPLALMERAATGKELKVDEVEDSLSQVGVEGSNWERIESLYHVLGPRGRGRRPLGAATGKELKEPSNVQSVADRDGSRCSNWERIERLLGAPAPLGVRCDHPSSNWERIESGGRGTRRTASGASAATGKELKARLLQELHLEGLEQQHARQQLGKN
jgi:hypothetical protein